MSSFSLSSNPNTLLLFSRKSFTVYLKILLSRYLTNRIPMMADPIIIAPMLSIRTSTSGIMIVCMTFDAR